MRMKILVLDDEDVVREVLKQLLEHLGHEVSLVDSCEAAIDAYVAAMVAGVGYDVVILDLNLDVGALDGRETARRILAVDSAASLVVSTGFSQDPSVLNFADYGFVAAMCKPYRLDQLVSVLDSVKPNLQPISEE